MLYFNFVRAAAAEPLVPVFHHNQMDLRGLAAIAGRVVELLSGCGPERLAGAEEPSDDALDIYGLARLLERRGEPTLARNTYRAALDAGLPQRFERAARRDLAKLSKRAGDLPQAAELWESLLHSKRADADRVGAISPEQSLALERVLLRGITVAGEDAGQLRDTLEACEQLAIYFEHHTKALGRASQMSEHALALLRRSRGAPRQSRRFENGGDFRGRFETRFAHRLARLVRKANRADSLLSDT
jgi:tetratricopeptide (TPR) repeat protein